MADFLVNWSELQSVFLEEAEEHLATLERGLLTLETAPDDDEVLHQIFRAAHSIKGASGTVGLGAISRYTHTLESLLDRMRERTLAITPARIGELLRAADVLRALLGAARTGEPAPEDEVAASLAELSRALEEDSAPVPAPAVGPAAPADAAGAPATPTAPAAHVAREYAVRFVPSPDVLRTGMDPLLILRSLAELGELSRVALDASALPALDALDPETSYLGWALTLRTDKSVEEIRDVFAFVEDTSVVDVCALEDARPAQDAPPAEATPDGPPPPSLARPVHAEAAKAGPAGGATLRVATEKVDRLIDLVGELVIAHSMIIEAMKDGSPAGVARLAEAVDELGRNTRDLQERVMAVRMIPVGTVFKRFPRLVHDLSAAHGKSIALEIVGEETEIDKGMVEQLVDPLTHLVRNAIDHGIEPADERARLGKPTEGRIRLCAFHHGGSVVIEVSDDGRGLSLSRIRDKAVKMGLVRETDALSDQELQALIFAPGFSTASAVTDLSGRGVGMDVVKRNVEALSGALSVTSTPNEGCRMRIALPLTLTVLDGLTLRVADETFVLPLTSIVESFRPTRDQVKTVFGRGEIVRVRGESLPMIRLHRLLSLSSDDTDPCRAIVCIVEAGTDRFALLVDELLGQSQVVVKALESNYRRVDGFMGATIMGNGRVALILDAQSLARRADLARARFTAETRGPVDAPADNLA